MWETPGREWILKKDLLRQGMFALGSSLGVVNTSFDFSQVSCVWDLMCSEEENTIALDDCDQNCSGPLPKSEEASSREPVEVEISVPWPVLLQEGD